MRVVDTTPMTIRGKPDRIGALRRFGTAITVLTLLGHSLLGFEQPWIYPFVALATTYTMELVFATLDSMANGRQPPYVGGVVKLIDFLLPAHITGLAVALLLYPGDRLGPLVFACVIAISSKYLLRAGVPGHKRHFFNPSNFGIATTLLLFPSVGIAPPYHFTERIDGVADWILPVIIVGTGTFLNARFTRRLPLIAAWLFGFVAQAGIRSILTGASFTAAVVPITGVAFVLFTFYMVTDPATTPVSSLRQVAFGSGVAATYGLLMTIHIAFGLFFSLAIVSLIRGAFIIAQVADTAHGHVANVPQHSRLGAARGSLHAANGEPLLELTTPIDRMTPRKSAEREDTLV